MQRSAVGVAAGAWLDSRLSTWSARRQAGAPANALHARWVETPVGAVRVLVSGVGERCVLLVPDGPNVVEHYTELCARLSARLRVVCFDMPGFGFSWPRADYFHSLDQGARAVIGVLDALHIARATLAFSCANGLYALRVARVAPERVVSLFLSQTPSLHAMHAWAGRVIPGVLRVPLLGQAVAWAASERLARHWYARALPAAVNRASFREPACAALNAGACFSLSGVVQGLLRESQSPIEGVSAPCTMLWGADDRTHAETDPASLLECAAGAQIVHCAGVGHFPDLEQPARFADLLMAQVTACP